MSKYSLSFLITMAIATVSFGQTTKQKTDELKNDPRTIENAAKADDRLIDKKIIADRLIDKKIIADSSLAKPFKAKKREKGCKFNRKKKSAGN